MAAEQQPICPRHGRPAVAQRIRRLPDGTEEVEYLCEIDLAEERMSSPFQSGSKVAARPSETGRAAVDDAGDE